MLGVFVVVFCMSDFFFCETWGTLPVMTRRLVVTARLYNKSNGGRMQSWKCMNSSEMCHTI